MVIKMYRKTFKNKGTGKKINFKENEKPVFSEKFLKI